MRLSQVGLGRISSSRAGCKMLASRYLVRRASTVLQLQQQQQRTAATSAAPARRTWTAYKKPALASTATPASAAAASAPTATELQAAVGVQEDDFDLPLPELEPPSSAQPLAPTRTSPAAPSSSSLASAPLPSLSTQLAPSYPSPTPAAPQQQQEIDWSTSFHGISSQPFSPEQAAVLMRPLVPAEIEIKPGK